VAKASPSLDEQLNQAARLNSQLREVARIVDRIDGAIKRLPPLAQLESRVKAVSALYDRLSDVWRLFHDLPPLEDLKARAAAVAELAAGVERLLATWAKIPSDEQARDLDRTANRIQHELRAIVELVPQLPSLDQLQQLADALPPPPMKKGR
jgi:ABC-type transporter Mla subunit MlaD